MRIQQRFVLLFLGMCPLIGVAADGPIVEFPLAWPGNAKGSTHELAFAPGDDGACWVTGQTHDCIARVGRDGKAEFFPMPKGSRPHGIVFDAAGQLWISLEYHGLVAQIDAHGKIVRTIDIRMKVDGAREPINPYPHGLGLGGDGRTIWFTGKKTSTVGKINPDGTVEHFELPTIGAVPIYMAAGWDGNVWCTELVGYLAAAESLLILEVLRELARPVRAVDVQTPGPSR